MIGACRYYHKRKKKKTTCIFPIDFLIGLPVIQITSHEYLPEGKYQLEGSVQSLHSHSSSRSSSTFPAILCRFSSSGKLAQRVTPVHERKMPLKNMTLLTEQWRCVWLGLSIMYSIGIFETRDCESNISQIILPKCSEKELLVPQSKKDFQRLILIS